MIHNDYIFSLDNNTFRFKRQFDEMYRNSDDPHGQMSELDRLDYKFVVQAMRHNMQALANTKTKILDVGCGLGVFTHHLADCFPGHRVEGCDISPAAIAHAQATSPGQLFYVMDLKSEPRKEILGSYDYLLALHVLCYFEENEIHGVIDHLHALLKPRGYLMAGYHLPKKMNFGRYITSRDTAQTLFAQHGFSLSVCWDIWNHMDKIYNGDVVGRNLYFLVQRE